MSNSEEWEYRGNLNNETITFIHTPCHDPGILQWFFETDPQFHCQLCKKPIPEVIFKNMKFIHLLGKLNV